MNSLAHTKWNCIYHIVFISEISQKSDVWQTADVAQDHQVRCLIFRPGVDSQPRVSRRCIDSFPGTPCIR